MSVPDDEDRLREQFARLRADDERAAPPFAVQWQAASARASEERTRTSPWIALSFVAAAGSVAVVTLAVVAMLPSADRVPTASAPQPAQERAPLEFLLDDAPGRAATSRGPDFDSDPLAGLTRSVPAGFE